MTLSSAITDSAIRVKTTVEQLKKKDYECELDRRSGDEERIKKGEEAFKKVAGELKTHAKTLAEAAARL